MLNANDLTPDYGSPAPTPAKCGSPAPTPDYGSPAPTHAKCGSSTPVEYYKCGSPAPERLPILGCAFMFMSLSIGVYLGKLTITSGHTTHMGRDRHRINIILFGIIQLMVCISIMCIPLSECIPLLSLTFYDTHTHMAKYMVTKENNKWNVFFTDDEEKNNLNNRNTMLVFQHHGTIHMINLKLRPIGYDKIDQIRYGLINLFGDGIRWLDHVDMSTEIGEWPKKETITFISTFPDKKKYKCYVNRIHIKAMNIFLNKWFIGYKVI